MCQISLSAAAIPSFQHQQAHACKDGRTGPAGQPAVPDDGVPELRRQGLPELRLQVGRVRVVQVAAGSGRRPRGQRVAVAQDPVRSSRAAAGGRTCGGVAAASVGGGGAARVGRRHGLDEELR